MDLDDFKSGILAVIVCFIGLLLICGLVMGVGAVYSSYSVWSKGKAGQAQLAEADYNRKIAVREAEAKKESSQYLAQADVIRAKGIAEANKIIGDSLKTNEKYLEWKFIDELQQNKNQIIYLPTNTVLPILEAARGK